MLHKHLNVKDITPSGEVQAVFATLNVKDSDGDVTLPGFFGEQRTRMVWGHAWGGDWIGKGSVHEEGNEAIFEGGFFMDTKAGEERFKQVRAMEDLAEWSYGFDILKGGAKAGEFAGERVRFLQPAGEGPGSIIHEVSPVLVGAGEGTRTVSLKGDQTPSHHPEPGAPADLRACIAGIAALNGARGGLFIPEGEKQAAYEHLAGHLRDAALDPPAMRSHPDEDVGLKFTDELTVTLVDVQAVVERAQAIEQLRAEKGKTLSAGSLALMAELEEELKQLQTVLTELRTPTPPSLSRFEEAHRQIEQTMASIATPRKDWF